MKTVKLDLFMNLTATKRVRCCMKLVGGKKL